MPRFWKEKTCIGSPPTRMLEKWDESWARWQFLSITILPLSPSPYSSSCPCLSKTPIHKSEQWKQIQCLRRRIFSRQKSKLCRESYVEVFVPFVSFCCCLCLAQTIGRGCWNMPHDGRSLSLSSICGFPLYFLSLSRRPGGKRLLAWLLLGETERKVKSWPRGTVTLGEVVFQFQLEILISIRNLSRAAHVHWE